MTKPPKTQAQSIGAAVVSSAALTGTATAGGPFGMRDLAGGYLQLASSEDGKPAGTTPASDKAMEGKCGEGRCGAGMGSGAKPVPAAEGDAKPTAPAADKAMEGKCGEGKCGSSMKK